MFTHTAMKAGGIWPSLQRRSQAITSLTNTMIYYYRSIPVDKSLVYHYAKILTYKCANMVLFMLLQRPLLKSTFSCHDCCVPEHHLILGSVSLKGRPQSWKCGHSSSSRVNDTENLYRLIPHQVQVLATGCRA